MGAKKDAAVGRERAGQDVHVARRAALFYRNLVTRVVELGEIARIELEIQRRFPHGASPPRCPCWHNHKPPHGQHEAPR